MPGPSLEKQLQKLSAKAEEAAAAAADGAALRRLKVFYLGKKGRIALMKEELKRLPAKDRPAFGKAFNQAVQSLKTLCLKKEQELNEREIARKLKGETQDVSLPGPASPSGAPHPVFWMMDRIADIFTPIGWTVRSGPCVETDFRNFEALNIPPFHPSRDLQDTFYIDSRHVLRTHTSPVQIRVMESEAPPLAVLAPGAVFRADEKDASHSPVFHQTEGLFVDKKVSLADLKSVLSYAFRELFGSSVKMRLRPGFFPFTEPSAEYDMSCTLCRGKGCSFCKQSGWIEMGGCGLVHPNVFHAVKLSPAKWQGFAFGLGVERLASLFFNVPDIRLFYQNDLRFLRQFDRL